MKAFISWSGSRQLLLAKAVREWLKTISPEIQPFISRDLPKGSAWFDELAKELADAEIGLICLAPPRVASDWQLVEAGAIWKTAKPGGLFPLCFRTRLADIPQPLRDIQLTHFDEEDFRQLATDIANLIRPGGGSMPKRKFAQSWSKLKASVEGAFRRPDDSVHTTRGFIHEVAGGWWERVKSEGGHTKLSWMWVGPPADGAGPTIRGRGFGEGGSDASEWRTDLVSVRAGPEPTLDYYWEGEHPHESNLQFGGKCSLQFTIAEDGSIKQGRGEFKDVCLNEARPPQRRMVNVLRASPIETAIMQGADENKCRALAKRKLKTWPVSLPRGEPPKVTRPTRR